MGSRKSEIFEPLFIGIAMRIHLISRATYGINRQRYNDTERIVDKW